MRSTVTLEAKEKERERSNLTGTNNHEVRDRHLHIRQISARTTSFKMALKKQTNEKTKICAQNTQD